MIKGLVLAMSVLTPSLAIANFIECGGRMISRGSSSAEVAALCGKPAQVDDNSVLVGVAAPTAGEPNAIAGSVSRQKIETWTYNFGPDSLMERIHIVDGRVTEIEDLGYGY